MPVAMALLRDVQNLCPKDVLNFILDLIKYNDNRKNKVQKALAVMSFWLQLLQWLEFVTSSWWPSSSLSPPPALHSFQTTTIEPIWSKRSPTLWLQPSALTTRCALWTIWTQTCDSSWKRSRASSTWRSFSPASETPLLSGEDLLSDMEARAAHTPS